MDEKFLKPYDAAATEAKIYELWEQSGLFNPDVCIEKGFTDASAEPFSIVLPPPNVTGTLHMGSSLMLAIEDTVVRFERMRGKKTLWIPGMDHAAIATQSKVEKLLEKEGTRKADLGREEFLKRVNAFADANKATMKTQLKALGSSLDWTREAYTLDEKRELAVRTAFKKMYDEGLIYRGHRIVNWDPKGQTTISDDEIVYEERKATIYTFKYSPDFPISIATTRPETKVGDVAVAVNPADERYQKYVGQTFEIADFAGVPLSIKIVADDSVDPEYGTGAVGVTPAHSMVDTEIAKRHNLPTIQVINEYAKMMVDAPALKDKKVGEAREIILEWLRSNDLLEKEEDAMQNLSLAERTGGIIEPLPKLQWFIDVNKPIPSRDDKSLKQLMHDAIEKNGIKILPDRFEKVYFHWIENLRDWCISRQIWFGHRIPVWYCLHCKNIEVNADPERNLFLVRHGLTDHNKSRILQGVADIPLNDEGREQARQAGERLKNEDIKYVISSDLIRARETAEIIQKITGGELLTTEKLREKNFGDIEGISVDEAKSSYPEIYTYDGKAPNGESYREVEERVFGELEKLIEKYSGNLVIVSHGGAMRTMVRRIKNIDPALMKEMKTIGNCEILPIDIMRTSCLKCHNNFFEQDEDTLDTWFSSGLWTFSTLGWPEKTKDLKNYHPTALLETGYDILFFWVARMILMSKYLLDEVPFKTVYLHGLVRDNKGQKISKSLGNNVEPLEMIAKYGADAVRMSLLVGTGPGNDSKLSEEKLKAYKHFANKLWNVARFVLSQKELKEEAKNTEKDSEYLSELKNLEIDVTKDLESYKMHLAAEKIYHYVWHKFADVIIEEYKQKLVSFDTLDTILEACLKLLHPFMPFITEEIWNSTGKDSLLMVEKWPSVSDNK